MSYPCGCSIRERDPFNFRVISVYVGTLVELGKKRELYHYAHQMVSSTPCGILKGSCNVNVQQLR
jgi:hypothetical protein